MYTTATAAWNLRCGDLQSIVTLPATTAESSEIVSEPLPSGIDAATVGIIAGVIGGVLLLAIAGLAVFVCRNKRTRTAQPSVEVPSQMSIYGPVDLPPPSNYSSAPPIERSNTYDFLTPAEAMQK